MRQVIVSSIFNRPFEDIRQLVLQPQTMVIISRPVVVFVPVSPLHLPAQWADGQTYRVRILLFGLIPVGWYEIRIRLVRDQKDVFIGKDQGRGLITPTWDHTVILKRRGTQTVYRDKIDIAAGWLTPLVALFAKAIYTRRQRRWKTVILPRNR